MRGKVKEEVVKKCTGCSQDLIVGQKFCDRCGSKQDTPMKTAEDVSRMRKELFKIKPSDPKKMLPTLMMIMMADMVLGWVLGSTSDKKLLELIEGPNSKGGEINHANQGDSNGSGSTSKHS